MSTTPFQTADQPYPHSVEGERAVLGAILINNSLMAHAVQLFPDDEMFYLSSHRRIFSAMKEVYNMGGEIDPILIGEELRRRGELQSVGGVSSISLLTHGLPRADKIDPYAKVIRGKYLLRQLIKESYRIITDAMVEEEEPEIILDRAEHNIFSIAEARIRQGLEHVQPIAQRLLDKVQEMEGRPSMLTGLTTGFTELDTITSGMQPADLIIIAARPSMGKTSFALMLAENAAIAEKAVVAIFSLEMAKEPLVMRMLCSQGNIDAHKFRTGFLSRTEWVQIAKSLSSLADTKIFLDDSPAMNILEMRAKARRLAADQKRLDLIIVDYLQLMGSSSQRSESRQQEVSQISRDLKILAKELNVPVVALSQLSRAPETRADHRPQLSDLRESGALEQDADLVAFIYREEVYKTPDERLSMPEDKKNLAEIIVAKQRNGPTGTVELRFVPSSMRFDNLYRE
jgi:replicative DNA helicase